MHTRKHLAVIIVIHSWHNPFSVALNMFFLVTFLHLICLSHSQGESTPFSGTLAIINSNVPVLYLCSPVNFVSPTTLTVWKASQLCWMRPSAAKWSTASMEISRHTCPARPRPRATSSMSVRRRPKSPASQPASTDVCICTHTCVKENHEVLCPSLTVLHIWIQFYFNTFKKDLVLVLREKKAGLVFGHFTWFVVRT